MSSRLLDNTEIAALKDQGCFSSHWAEIRVGKNFSAEPIRNVRFQGKVELGLVSGLFNSTIENCEIGNDVLIENVPLIRNYRIEDRVVIQNVDAITVTGTSSFGNGTEIEVLNEGGGRELILFDKLSAQLAYMQVCYRHDQGMVDEINRMIQDYTRLKKSESGSIGSGTKISNVGSIHNMNIGGYATIKGATLLENGTIKSNKDAPSFVGEAVIAKNCILLSGSAVDNGALVEKCFVGQGVEIGKQFSAENSLFFANSEAFHGEAVSAFAGPYTVTHHKSTLLIAGLFSFFNAGSGTNQSNHMYKLGPVHQGIVERGSKTGSFAYLLWPSRIGPYTVVMGKNMASFDSSEFPFSYINVDHEKSILTPGMNLFTVGTRRDSEKWPNRDKRTDPEKYDLINFDFLSPYIMQKVIRSLDILKELYEKASQKQETVFYKGIRIKRLMLRSTRKYYEMALAIFIGNQVVNRLDNMGEINSMEALRDALATDNATESESWIDMAGMVAPDSAVQALCRAINSGKIKNVDGIASRLKDIHESYDDYTWDWTTKVLADIHGIDVRSIGADQLLELVSKWETESVKLNKMILNDAGKEFDEISKIGFGIDGGPEEIDLDFEAVRGTHQENKFITGIHKEIEQIEQKAASLKLLIGSIQSDPA